MSKEWTVGGASSPEDQKDIVYLRSQWDYDYEVTPIKRKEIEYYHLTLTNDRSNILEDGIIVAEFDVKNPTADEFYRYYDVVGENHQNVSKNTPDEKYNLRVSVADLERIKRIFLLAMQVPNQVTPEEVRFFLRAFEKREQIREKIAS